MLEDLVHIRLELLERLVAPSVGLYPVAPEVGGHDDDRVLEVHRAPLGIGKPAIVEDLEKYVEDVGMRLLYLVQKQHRVRAAADLFCELSCLLVANIAWRCTNQTTDGVTLLERTERRLHAQNIEVEFTEAAVEFVSEEGFDPEFGARPLRRTIQRRVDNVLSRMVLEGSLNPGDKVVVDLEEGKLTFGVLDETAPMGTTTKNDTGE